MIDLLAKIKTAYALGLTNLWRVYAYKLSLKLGLHPVCRLKSNFIFENDFFYKVEKIRDSKLKVNLQWIDQHIYFGWFKKKDTDPPQWHQNVFNQQFITDIEKQWYEIADFDSKIGDIKTIWEASRFDWVLGFSQSVAQGDQNALVKLNGWLKDWCKHNPPYRGANWKCGQEASIRVMHLCVATSFLDQHKAPSGSLVQFVDVHLKRIAPTIHYAIAQNNNHGTSEAAALFIGGSFLVSLGHKKAVKYQKVGRKWLENRAKRLIEKDGTFSQYSVNYHRVMLDTYSMVEYWRRLLNLPKFSTKLYSKLAVASHWLLQMIQVRTGDTPNLGTNDGARLLPLSATDYRDFRPSVQLASVLFKQQSAYTEEGSWDIPLYWLKLEKPVASTPALKSVFLAQGGYSLLHKNKAFVLFNIPNFKFRPSQADALHVDFWFNGENLLRDAGTYSYNSENNDLSQYFSGTKSHNTIQFDDHDQMPRLSRFLLGAWLKAKQIIPLNISKKGIITACGYLNDKKNNHHRLIELCNQKLLVTDTISGFNEKAVLRWRLKPGEWLIDKKNKIISNGIHELNVSSTVHIIRFEIVEGWESHYYLKKTPLPVLEVEISKSGQLVTEYNFTGSP